MDPETAFRNLVLAHFVELRLHHGRPPIFVHDAMRQAHSMGLRGDDRKDAAATILRLARDHGPLATKQDRASWQNGRDVLDVLDWQTDRIALAEAIARLDRTHWPLTLDAYQDWLDAIEED